MQQLKHISLELSIVLILLFTAILVLFLHCFFGKIVTDSFSKMADSLFEANWKDLPVELQKYFILMIGNAQRPLYYYGSNVVRLDLQTFASVSK